MVGGLAGHKPCVGLGCLEIVRLLVAMMMMMMTTMMLLAAAHEEE
jgi:hypothetical protein